MNDIMALEFAAGFLIFLGIVIVGKTLLFSYLRSIKELEKEGVEQKK